FDRTYAAVNPARPAPAIRTFSTTASKTVPGQNRFRRRCPDSAPDAVCWIGLRNPGIYMAYSILKALQIRSPNLPRHPLPNGHLRSAARPPPRLGADLVHLRRIASLPRPNSHLDRAVLPLLQPLRGPLGDL